MSEEKEVKPVTASDIADELLWRGLLATVLGLGALLLLQGLALYAIPRAARAVDYTYRFLAVPKPELLYVPGLPFYVEPEGGLISEHGTTHLSMLYYRDYGYSDFDDLGMPTGVVPPCVPFILDANLIVATPSLDCVELHGKHADEPFGRKLLWRLE